MSSTKVPEFKVSKLDKAAEGLLGRLEASVESKMKALFAR